MKYRLTPLHVPTLYFFGEGIYQFYVLSKSKYDPELGVFLPFLSIGIGLIILVIDLVIQIGAGLTVKNNPRRTIYVIEFVVIIIGLLWVLRTYFPTVHNQ
jgi:hypothetical protein